MKRGVLLCTIRLCCALHSTDCPVSILEFRYCEANNENSAAGLELC